ncbi:MAG: hypothetical protein C5B58_15885 [Acidobacteria bacterium]|nr:MAG: hypothetical protein C5B58_15885 [Acidobacteriota bacterium]
MTYFRWCIALTLLWAGALPAQSPSSLGNPTQVKKETCVISGIVVRREDKAPLKGATVQLENREDPDHTIAAKTSADGRFELHNVPAGQYRLKVRRNGYVEFEYGQKKSSDPGATFTLRPGQTMSDLVLPLSRAAVIAGRVLDEDGEPMAGATLLALKQVYSEGQKKLDVAAESSSDDRGEYRLFGLKPGRYFLSAQPQIWGRTTGDLEFSGADKQPGERNYAKVYYPGVSNPGKATSISVKEGEEISAIDILMKEVAVFRIRGRVVNLISKRGNRETNVQVMGRGQEVAWDFVGGKPTIKADGSFEMADILPGEYTVSAFFFDEGGKIYAAEEDVDVGNADVNGVTITIGPGVTIPGRISWEGKPSWEGDDATVTAEPIQSGLFWGGRSHVDSEGQFSLKDVPQGAFRIRVAGLSKDCYIKEIRQGESVLADDVLRVTRGSASPLEITVSSRGGRVEGVVTNEANLPTVGVWVVAVPEETKRKMQRFFKSFTTDQYGRFNLRGMAPGRYTLFAWEGIEQDAWEDGDFLKGFDGKGVAVEVKEGAAQALELNLIQVKDSSTRTD